MPKKSFSHIFISRPTETPNYTSPRGGGGSTNIPKRNRHQHGRFLKRKFKTLWKESKKENEKLKAVGLSAKNGIYVEFQSQNDFDLITKSLENISQGVRILNIREDHKNDKKITLATVYIPNNKASYFLKKIEDYLRKNTPNNSPKNKNLINSIEDIRLAVLDSFWQDNKKLMPRNNQVVGCEVWLRVSSIQQEISDLNDSFFSLCSKLKIKFLNEQKISFPERLVVLIHANKKQLLDLIKSSDHIAEFRRAKETAKFWLDQENIEQLERVRDLEKRLSIDQKSKISICLLDTGVNNGHQLIAPVLSDEDCHTVNQKWGIDDSNGHGTLMSGLAIYSDLQEALRNQETVNIRHKLESVKLIPPPGQYNRRDLYGDITKQGISEAEIAKPENKRVICMAITSNDDRDKGRPSSWSGALDQITSGAEDDKRRLFIVSAGNIKNDVKELKNYPKNNITNAVHDPAQSWNALTVGAYTKRVSITDEKLKGYTPLAKEGELSPFSTTSCSWETKKWPLKPDIVLEGGNIAIHPNEDISAGNEDLHLLSLSHRPQEAQFNIINGTSAAAAQAAWIASQIQVQYPKIWPETIRALMVHSAEWNESMKNQFWDENKSDKHNYRNILRIFGYGVPNLERAISSYNNSLTLISEQELQPFTKNQSSYSTKDMHFYEMPWPKKELRGFPDNTSVRLRITLSYFIEPGPGEIGWKDRYRYPSHGLRFSLCNPQENKNEFIQRVNKSVRDEDYDSSSSSSDSRWIFGFNNRDLGSIHSDIWEGLAPEIAECNFISVYPTIGWWRERSHLKKFDKKARYSLIVSLSTPEENVDIYTPVRNQITTTVPI